MKNYFYYRIFRKTIIQFMELFNDIQIGRYNNNGELLSMFKVPIRFAPKSKAWIYIQDNAKNEHMLPMITVDLQSIEFDNTRLGNRQENIMVSKNIDEKTAVLFRNAIPYNMSFNLRVWSLHMIDVDQIMEQILPFFAPYVFIRINVPEVDTDVDVKVVLESCTVDPTEDLSESDARILKWTVVFEVQTWLFQPISDNTGLIGKIFTNYYTNKESWKQRDNKSEFEPGAIGFEKTDVITGIGYDEDAKLLYEYEEWL